MDETKDEVCFRVAATPLPQPRQKHGAVVKGDGRAMSVNYLDAQHPIHELKAQIRTAAREALGDRPLLEGPLHLGLAFVLARPAALTKKKGPNLRVPCDRRKGDIDNFTKAVMDALNEVLWHDDCQVTSLYATKEYAAADEAPHTLVLVQAMSPQQNPSKTPDEEAPDGTRAR